MTNLIGYHVNKPIICQLCGMRRDHGGFAVKNGPAPGIYCSAEHARVALERKEASK